MKSALMVVSGLCVGLLVSMGRDRWMSPAEAQVSPLGDHAGTVMATGGASSNQQDLCWILSKVKPVVGPERTVLALYKADKNGDLMQLKDVRFIDADLRLIELNAGVHKPSVTDVLKALPKAEADSLRPQPPPQNP